ncbi:MAG: hypothetical protein P8J27_07705 [Mariniblastus sp.]|nr:hypothetical protein [Mariniblastus sp.]
MIRLVRIIGSVLIAIGFFVILAWLIKPIRDLLPSLYDAFRAMPIAIQIGLLVATVGLVLLFSSILWERIEDAKQEGSLLDDD